MKHEAVEGGTLWTNDTAIAQGITLAAGTKCITLQPGESHFEPLVVAPEGDLAAVACYAAWVDKRV